MGNVVDYQSDTHREKEELSCCNHKGKIRAGLEACMLKDMVLS